MPTESTGGGPTPLAERAVGPDLARGVMLLLIAVANVHIWLYGDTQTVRGYLDTGFVADGVLAMAQTVLADGPGLPLFAAVLGFGITHLAERSGRATVSRRALVMIGLGLVHGILLFPGEILAAYGLVTLLVVPALTGPTRVSSGTLLAIAGGLAILPTLLGTSQGRPGGGLADPSLMATDYATVLAVHPELWLNYAIAGVLFGLPAALIGVCAARLGLLDEPADHRAQLRRWALVGSAGMIVLGAPLGVVAAGWWVPGADAAALIGAAHVVAGYAGVFGYLGLFGLLATVSFPGRATLAAAGTWSMTLYLSQSVVFGALLPAWALGLGDVVTIAQASLIGVVTWLVGIVVAGRLALAGHRGPAELVVRRVAYAGERRSRV